MRTEKGRLASIQNLLKEAGRDELTLIREEAF
jgi:hypothetical protein